MALPSCYVVPQRKDLIGKALGTTFEIEKLACITAMFPFCTKDRGFNLTRRSKLLL